MEIKAIIKSQYWAALEMLRGAIKSCPADLWNSDEYKNRFWHVAYHAVFYTHFYLHPTEADFIPWEKHKAEHVSLGNAPGDARAEALYSKYDLLAYLGLCREQMDGLVDSLDLEAESGFYWLPFNKLELQFYNLRHLQQHTGELCERLGAHGDIEVGWVGMKPTEAG